MGKYKYNTTSSANKKDIAKRFVLPNNTILFAHYYETFSGV